jgi:hypothetical protein
VTVPKFRYQRLALANSAGLDLSSLDDDYMWDKIVAAEAEVGRKLGVFLQATEVFSIEASDAALAAIGTRPYVIEPGYDLPPDFFQIGRFGAMRLNHTPVLSVTSMSLRHPALATSAFDVPPSWLMLVGKSGLLQVMPGSGVQTLPLALFTMQAMGSGYTIPQMIRVQYTAGLTPAHALYPEVVDATLRAATLLVLADALLPQSGSISADGLSQSLSQDVAKHQEALDAKLEGLRERIVGPVWGAL